jgi:hypothetical protein
MSEYRIAEEHNRFHIEKLAKGNSWDSWIALNEPHVPRFFETLADARSWVATIKRGVVYHDAEDDGLQWFIDRIGKRLMRDGLSFQVMDDDHARHLRRLSQEMGYTYEDAPNLPVDERKAESGNKVSDEWESIATRYIVERLKDNAIVDFDGESTHTISSVHIGRDNKIVISI